MEKVLNSILSSVQTILSGYEIEEVEKRSPQIWGDLSSKNSDKVS